MELKEFVSTTIEQISLGVLEAAVKCKPYDVIVNPNITVGGNGDYSIPKNPEKITIQRRVQVIEMDISVIAETTEESGVDAKLNIPILSIGGDSKGKTSTSNENRVRFSIPVCLPVTEV
jgi:hypothetical protein